MPDSALRGGVVVLPPLWFRAVTIAAVEFTQEDIEVTNRELPVR